MPKVRRQNLPRSLFRHLADRVQEREITTDQLELLFDWLETEPEVPEGRWFKHCSVVTSSRCRVFRPRFLRRVDLRPRRRMPRVRRAPVIRRKLWCDEFAVEMAEAEFKESTVTGSKFQYIYHVDMTTCERLINPCRLQDHQIESPIQGPRLAW